MSANNGDKARSHRERKKKVLRRQRTRELRKRLSLESKVGRKSQLGQRGIGNPGFESIRPGI